MKSCSGLVFLSTVIEDFSRFIVTLRLCASTAACDISVTLHQALAQSGPDRAEVVLRSRSLSDNAAFFVSTELATRLKARAMVDTRGKPRHPRSQGKIERFVVREFVDDVDSYSGVAGRSFSLAGSNEADYTNSTLLHSQAFGTLSAQ